MNQAVEEAAAEHSSAADASADGQVEECIDVLGGAPAMFPEGGGIDVGIEKDLRAGGLPDNGCERVVAPSEFGSSGDGSCGEVDGAKAADADGGYGGGGGGRSTAGGGRLLSARWGGDFR